MNASEKAMWRTVVAQYRAWNEAKFRAEVRNAGTKSPQQKLEEFMALMEFGLMLKPMPSPHEQRQKVEMLNRGCELMQLFVERSKSRG
ncbi:hypothetical protein L0128_17195 [candidate division KSB1 bacterium]|nr:hypothetical protein [candidate division KSB1 bacterium]